jgi:hypothetical protein
MNTAEFVVGCLCGVVILCMFVWIGIALRLGYTKMELMLGHLKNSSSVQSLASLKHGGPWGKLLVVGGISGFVTFSGFYVRRGGVNAQDVHNFPATLKRTLAMLQWSAIWLFGVLVILVIVGKSGLLK